jgi:prepilin-type N-terminal cleavage/methylation domain-containing protein
MRTRLRAIVRDERGFSLIELLTALAILLTVMLTLTTLMVSATRSEVDLTRRVQAQQETRLALEMIRHEIHRACKAEHVDLTNGAIVTPGSVQTNVRLVPPVSSGCPATTNLATAVTWCMGATSDPQRWALRRIVGLATFPATCSGGRKEADYITTSAVFTLPTPPSGSLMKLSVNFPVDIDPNDGKRRYRLEDSLVLRNSERAP